LLESDEAAGAQSKWDRDGEDREVVSCCSRPFSNPKVARVVGTTHCLVRSALPFGVSGAHTVYFTSFTTDGRRRAAQEGIGEHAIREMKVYPVRTIMITLAVTLAQSRFFVQFSNLLTNTRANLNHDIHHYKRDTILRIFFLVRHVHIT
jgi:hypothetical protein